MAYRTLVVGDDVKIVKCGDWTGMFGKVLDSSGDLITVKFRSWRGGHSSVAKFTSDKLLLSNGDPYNHCDYTYDDEEEKEEDDQTVLRSLLERVAKLEKEMLDMKSQRK